MEENQGVTSLLMAPAAALANREARIAALDDSGASRLIEQIQRAYPEANDADDYFKELVRAIEARQAIEERGLDGASQSLVEDARLGRAVREAAQAAGAENPAEYVNNAMASARNGRRGEWPPFFSLSEAGGYYFDSGKATLRPAFDRNLRTVVIPMLQRNIADYGVNVVEVIGHTDEVPMSGVSNLDASLIAASSGRLPVAALQPTDNAGLAIARAVAVVNVLRSDPRLRGVTILPLSGAQMIVPVDRVADGSARGDDQSRRRIEIRLRRSTAQASTGGPTQPNRSATRPSRQ